MITRKVAIKLCFNCEDNLYKEYEKIYKNCILGKELKEEKIKNRYYCEINEINTWKEKRENSHIVLTKEHYLECLEFALKTFYSNAPKTNFGGTFQRDAGKYITDHVSGKLGEIAVKEFLMNKYNVEIKLDFDVHGNITSQDITSVKKRLHKPEVWNNPGIKVSIKSTKLKNYLLLISENEYELQDRSSDYYILVKVALPSDHIFRLLKDNVNLQNLKGIIHDFIPIDAYVCGYIKREKLNGPDTQIDNLNFENNRYYKRSGELENDWESFISLL